MNALFVITRVVTGLTSVIAFVVLSLVVFLRDTASTAKEGFSVLGYVIKLFATGFTEAAAPQTEAWHIGPCQIILGVLSLAMLVSVFTPGSRWFLHSIALLAGVVLIGYARMIFVGPSLEIACLPFLMVWFGYYAMCVFWRGGISVP
jgi:hypothetical protein